MLFRSLVAETGVATADLLFVAGTYGEVHDAVEASCATAFASTTRGEIWGHTGRIVIKFKVNGGSAANVGVATIGVFIDHFGSGEREEGQGPTRRLLGALHLQHFFFFCQLLLAERGSEGMRMGVGMDGPLAVASRATLLDLLRYDLNFDIILVRV